MQVTDTKEKGLETLIVEHLVNVNGFELGTNDTYNKAYAIDEERLLRFLNTTQPDEVACLRLMEDPLKRTQFFNRLQSEIAKRGIIDVLRKGVKDYPVSLTLFYQTPSEKNNDAHIRFEQNIFSVTRQLMYAQDNSRLALDLCLFVNGLPILTCELKNQLTKQNVDDAVQQYKIDRDPRELLFQFKRCMVHFAVDDVRVKFCTQLAGKSSWFLPFDKGWGDGAGNPPNPNGLKTDYMWNAIWTKHELANIIENFAQVVVKVDPKTKRAKESQIFPRYHQLAVVKNLLADVKTNGVGKRYLIQHSAGSGKSNSIAWLAHQLVNLEKNGGPVLDTIIVVTDRINLDKQIRDTIKQFMQVNAIFTWSEDSATLRKALQEGRKIIGTTVFKFPYILDDIGNDPRHRNFGIIIDEAHSSQSGRTAAQMNIALSNAAIEEDDETTEEKINRMMEGRKMLTNANYFAFTATPKNKTLEIFGKSYDDEGKIKYRPFHLYTMKQAIQEGFILDVLKYYTPILSYYKLAKTVEDDPQFDKKRAQKRLRAFVEGNEYPISKKAEIIVEHFHDQVIGRAKIGGKARAMVVTSSILRAIEYYYAVSSSLEERKSPYKAIIAFSGEKEYNGKKVTESIINQFPSHEIEEKLKNDPYRILIVADKFQTGYDEPLLHTMYVDKVLTDIKAVQTLSRLNRAHPSKHDTCVLDFANDPEDIKEAFADFYRMTILSDKTDPNKLNDMVRLLNECHIYSAEDVDKLVDLYLNNADRQTLDAILDVCVARYEKDLSQDDQIKFKGSAKAFTRTYGFLGAILPYGNKEWESLSIFLNLLIPKLPSPDDPDLSKGILETIDLDSYRLEKQQTRAISLEDKNAEVDPVPMGTASGGNHPEVDLLSQILNSFNEQFGNIPWVDADRVYKRIAEIPSLVSQDEAYQLAMKNSGKQNARLESENALKKIMFAFMSDDMELYKQFSDNPSFKAWLSEMVFKTTYNREGKSLPPPSM